ncbi:BCD family MFS transporter [filamentous cyanobacterium LEGE 11480]|uniref:BCD family MFS transporter n=1 Tax=Romeriopsis navalis LEGE 11480 TaxID=2777977 RepID=A0A928Z637_9CYAN|nr:BCD family MFS transporter [Romeriopsis navalis]MBE9031880.1 BCD family MFS transporter [Romeriopsis navalis LEGE 11480]
MAQNFSESSSNLPLEAELGTTRNLPRIGLLQMFQMGLFQMGLGIMSLLTLGVLNRVMINELAIPATIAAGAIAVHQFMSPARLWFGQMSDAKPILSYHRTAYVWIGTSLLAIASFLAVQVMWALGDSVSATGWSTASQLWVAALGVIFAFYGLALSSSSTPFAALLVDVSEEEERSKLVGIVWSMLMVGIVIGAITISRLLPQDGIVDLAATKASINRVFVLIPAIVCGLAVLGTLGIERKFSRFKARAGAEQVRDDQITLKRALKVLTASPQTGIFFGFLLFMTVSLFLQDAVLESYGGQVFNMSISETTKLNAQWGSGTLVGIATTGFAIVPKLGKKRTTKLGCALVACCAALLISSGFSGNPTLLKSAVFLFGLASGVTTTGALSLMLDLTAAATAGTFIGAWGLAQAMARGFSTVIGGAALDISKKVFPDSLVTAYGAVFSLQILGMIGAIILLSRVNIREFQTTAKEAISNVIQGELD